MTIYKEHIPYTYLIGWSKWNIWYYGSRTRKKCNPTDLWKTYFTSSKIVSQMREYCGEPDVIQIRRTFKTAKDALVWEHKVLEKIHVCNSNIWLNQHTGNSTFSTSGRKCSFAHKQKISKKLMNRYFSEETKNKISKSRQGIEPWNKGLSYKRSNFIPWNKGVTLGKMNPSSSKKGAESRIGKKAWNNGIITIKAFEKPDGKEWIHGMLRKKEDGI